MQHCSKKQTAYKDKLKENGICPPEGKYLHHRRLGLKKCKDSQTGIITFLIQNARNSGDKEREEKLIKSAKMRRSVNFEKVKEALI